MWSESIVIVAGINLLQSSFCALNISLFQYIVKQLFTSISVASSGYLPPLFGAQKISTTNHLHLVKSHYSNNPCIADTGSTKRSYVTKEHSQLVTSHKKTDFTRAINYGCKNFQSGKKVDQERILAHIDYVPMSAIIAKMH